MLAPREHGQRLLFATTVTAVAVAAWGPSYSLPKSGLDPSWHAGIYMALQEGLRHGSDIAFTYGPLGLLGLDGGELWYGRLAVIAVAFQSVLHLALCASLIYALRRSVGLAAAALLTYLALVVVDAPEIPLVLVAVLAVTALSPRAPAWSQPALLIVGAVLGAVECLVKLSLGPLVVLVPLLALIGVRAPLSRILAFFGLFTGTALLLWLVSGQSVGDIPGYVVNGKHLVGGYSENFGLADYASWYVPAAVALIAALVAGLCMLVIAFSTVKESVVRLDSAHVPILPSTALLIWLGLPWRGRDLAALGAGAVSLAVFAIQVSPGPAGADPDPTANVARFVDTAKTTLQPSRRAQMTESARAQLTAYYALPHRALQAVQGHSVAVMPYEIAAAWAYGLDWKPLPVIQPYAAYAPHLDRLNADAVASPDGPERILRHNLIEAHGDDRLYAVDRRLETWEAPAQNVAEVCHFVPEVTAERWQVLERVDDRCGEPEVISSVTTSPGEPVRVPRAPGDLVVAKVEGVGLTAAERLKALVLRGDPRHLRLDDGSSFRITPATAADGLLVDGPASVVGTGPFRFAPDSETLAVYGAPGPVRFEFLRIPIEAPASGRSDEAPGARRPERSDGTVDR